MELPQRERTAELIEELTTSGQGQLNPDKMKELKKICKVSNDCIDHVYHLLMSQLNQDHCEIRLSAFQIASELFSRSHHFRTLLVDNFQEFLELTVETDTEQPLPPPKEVAKKLRSLAIQTVQSWQASYGSAYKKLALGYHFLKQVKKVDFQDLEARTISERRREEERQRKMERIYKARVEAAAKEMEESYQEMESTLTEMESCLRLLLPEFGVADFQTDTSSHSNTQPASEGLPDVQQPCCSKALTDVETESGIRGREDGPEEENRTPAGNKNQDTGNEEEEKTFTDCSDPPKKGTENKEHNKEEKRQSEVKDGSEEGESSEEEESVEECLPLRSSGLISHAYSLDLNLSPGLHVKETEDNEAVVSTVIELHKLIQTKHLPAVQGWVQVRTALHQNKREDETSRLQVFTKSRADEQLLRRALDLKRSLEGAVQKHKELHIDYQTRSCREKTDTSDDDDDDFDEVPEKEGYEPHIPEHMRAEYGLDPSPSTSTAQPKQKRPPVKRPAPPPPQTTSRRLMRLLEEQQDPTSAAATLSLLRQKISLPHQSSSSGAASSSSQSASGQQAAQAPVVPFGLDLYYWGQEQPNAGKIIKSASQHQFWVPAEVEEEVENKELLEQSKSRYISFPGRFVPVSHFCRAPLGSGKLCQRQDRLKCPFHGPIIPRDEEGRPCRPEDRQREEQEERRKREQEPDWRDAELMRDIEAATGEDLGSDRLGGKKKKGKKKKKYPNLSDLKQSSDTSRSRLERKVFNKSTMRRVAQVLSKADRRKHDKFSNQFNYALN
ncbi:UV-stimulated scaffold protein A isoform X2 [Oryzias latipes]